MLISVESNGQLFFKAFILSIYSGEREDDAFRPVCTHTGNVNKLRCYK